MFMRRKTNGICDADWGSATASQRCVRPAGHGGVHIDSQSREWGWVPSPDPWGDESDDGETRAHVMSSSPGQDEAARLAAVRRVKARGRRAAKKGDGDGLEEYSR